MNWAPILQGSLRERALAAAWTIADQLVELGQDASLAGGNAGIALLYAYAERTRPGHGYGLLSRTYLAMALKCPAASMTSPSLYHGGTGVAWVASHLRHEAAMPEAVDLVLANLLDRRGWQGDCGLTDGLVGCGIYALERFGRPEAAETLERVVDRLAELAVPVPDGLAWATKPDRLPPHLRALAPDGCYDLGLARGLPGVIAVLAAALRLDVNARMASHLLHEAVRWLLAQRLLDKGRGPTTSCFPAWAGPHAARMPARSGWCHGDPGIAAALLLAARAAGEPRWEREAVAVARIAAGRPPAETMVTDAGFCHGTAGLAHIFNRLHQATGDREFGLSARFWVEQTLAMPLPAGNGLLRGATGVALALLAAATDVEPTWDRVFLLSLQ